jgi:RHS repeat-associated protein
VVAYHEFDPYGVPVQGGGEPYGFTGEWWDSYMELLFLRARYYSSGAGQFLSKDSWLGDYQRPLSMNPYLYAEANPVNRADPSGRFSNDTIARTFGVESFDQVLDIFEQSGGRWGLLRLLQEAEEGDTLEVGYEGKLAPNYMHPGRLKCQDDKIETERVWNFNDYLEYLATNPPFNVHKWWRANTIDWYFLNGGGFLAPNAPAWWKGGYTDWKDWTNLPDFYMVTGGVSEGVIAEELAYIVDRYGRRYLSGALGISTPFLPFDVSYAEGYIGQWNYQCIGNFNCESLRSIVVKSQPATRTEIQEFLVGWGETLYGTVIGGAVSTGGAASLFGVGLPGVSWTGSATIFLDARENPDLAWDWLDHVPMVGRYSILSQERNDSVSKCGRQ